METTENKKKENFTEEEVGKILDEEISRVTNDGGFSEKLNECIENIDFFQQLKTKKQLRASLRAAVLINKKELLKMEEEEESGNKTEM